MTSEQKAKQDIRPKVLVIDDDPYIRELISFALHEDFNVTICDHGKKALQLFSTKAFDLIVTDVVMPHMDGFSLVTELRKLGQQPILVISSGDRKESVEMLKGLGATDFLVKPFSADTFIEKIKTLTSG